MKRTEFVRFEYRMWDKEPRPGVVLKNELGDVLGYLQAKGFVLGEESRFPKSIYDRNENNVIVGLFLGERIDTPKGSRLEQELSKYKSPQE